MQMLKKTLLISLACAAAAPAFAHEEGSLILRAGAAMVTPNVSTDANLAPLSIDVDDNTQLGLTATYMFSNKLGVGLLAATPFEHDITAAGTTIGSTEHLPPTVTLQWFPLDNPTVQPYIGAGLNYTTFFNEELNATGQAATGASSMSLSDSVSWALEAGVDVIIGKNLVLNAAIWQVDINTDLSLNGTKVGEIELDPFAAMVGVGWKF